MTVEFLHGVEPEPNLDDCGVYAVYSPHDTALLEVKKGNDALVNRGEHSNGAAYIATEDIQVQKFLGTPEKAQYDIVPCRVAIGHDRYTTSKETTLTNAQPVIASFSDGVGNTWELACPRKDA